MSYKLTTISYRGSCIIDKYIATHSAEDNRFVSCIEVNRQNALDRVKGSQAVGAFHFYALDGYNEYAFYKSNPDTIYSLKFYQSNLVGYFKEN